MLGCLGGFYDSGGGCAGGGVEKYSQTLTFIVCDEKTGNFTVTILDWRAGNLQGGVATVRYIDRGCH